MNTFGELTQQAEFSRPLRLCEQVVILDGLTGTGKTMFSPLLSSLERMQNARFEYMVEYLCIAAEYGKLSRDAASSLLNLLADIKCYDGVISREVNFRPSDLSSVLHSTQATKYVRQLFQADGQAAGQRIEVERPILFFVTHQILSCIGAAIDAFGNRLRVVQMVRHPLYLLDHWDSYMAMHGTSPRDFTVWLEHSGKSVPWFARGWEAQYVAGPQFDNVVRSITSLMKPVFEWAQRSDALGKFAFVPFERFVLSPDPFLKEIERLIGTTSTAATRKVMRGQMLPRVAINAGPQKSIYKRYRAKRHEKAVTHAQDYDRLLLSAKRLASPAAFTELTACIKEYEKIFGLWF